MKTKDIAQRFLIENANVRGELVHLDQSLITILHQHHYPPAVAEFLGQILLAAVLMGSSLKSRGRLTLQMSSDGPVNLLVGSCDESLGIRGLAQWDPEVDSQELVAALGEGELVITVQLKDQAEPYQSIVPLEGRSVAEALEYYFNQSEQLVTRLWLEVDQSQASGLLLQAVPDDKGKVDELGWEHVTALASTLTRSELLDLPQDEILHRLFHQETVRVFDPRPVEFRCTCSPERMENAILMLGEKEVRNLLNINKEISVTCEFCNSQYFFEKKDVLPLFERRNPETLH